MCPVLLGLGLLEKNKDAGSHCSVEDQRLCESKIATLLQWWPKNKLELYEKCGVDGALKEKVDEWNTELRSLRTSRVSELHEVVCAQIFKAEIVMRTLEEKSKSEGTYCGHMKAHGTQVAQMQKELNQIGKRVKSEFPDIETSEGGGTASGQDGMAVSGEAQQEGTGGAAFDKLKTAYVACKACEDALYYFTTIYVGLTLLRTPVAANAESAAHGHLKVVVETIGKIKNLPSRDGAEIFKEELTAMRNMVICPRGAAAPAEVKAKAAGSPKQPQKPAETPCDGGGKRQRPSTPSIQTPVKRAKGVGRGSGGRDKKLIRARPWARCARPCARCDGLRVLYGVSQT